VCDALLRGTGGRRSSRPSPAWCRSRPRP
jgi:hypothetical protein